ncbi:MAG TPA: hemerythrin domain-containing protein [Tepidisphaeraceae bacterium]|nr:hemerythrin domain-containing protein [Tepidisphaeraceae bacterium]
MPVKLGSRPEHGFDQPLELLSDCHRRIENFLEILQRVLDEAAGRPLNEQQQRAVEISLEYFRTATPRHTADEEESLFPLLRQSGDPGAEAAIEIVQALEREHAAADVQHAEVEFWYRRWMEFGSLAAPQVRKLARVLEELRKMYERHIDIEDHEIFPLAGRVLDSEQLSELGAQMAERRGLSYDKQH